MSTVKGNGMAAAKAFLVTAVLNSLITPGHAQESPPAEPSQKGVSQKELTSEEPSQKELREKVLSYGPFDIRPSLRGGVMYDDNIFIRPTNKVDDVVWTITPGVLVGAGDYRVKEASYMTVFYAPTAQIFTDNSDETTLDHDARLSTSLIENKWRLSLDQGYQHVSGAVVDVGDRVTRSVYDTQVAFLYEISPKTTWDLSGRQRINDYKDYSNFNEWNLGTGVDYEVTPKVKAGLGLVFGWLDVVGSVNQTYQQLLGRASYYVSEKVEARGSLGGELRQFQGDQDDRASFVYSIGVNYKPYLNTSLTLDTYRRNQNSVVLADQNYTTTGVTAGVRQRFREKYTVYAGGGYESANYSANEQNVNADRDDDFWLARVGFDWQVLEKLVVGIFYQYRDNDSNERTYDFSNNQVGLTVGYEF